MISYLEKLRQKPESHRRKVQMFLSIAITFVVALFWSFSFSSDVNSVIAGSDGDQPSPFAIISDSFKGVVSNIGEGASITASKITGSEQDVIDDGADLIYISE